MPLLMSIGFEPATTCFDPAAVYRMGQNSRRCCSVACNIRGLARYFSYELCAHVFIRVFQLDFFCNSDAVFCDGRSAVFFVDDDIFALRAERGLDRIGEQVMPFNIVLLAASSNRSCFAIMFIPP